MSYDRVSEALGTNGRGGVPQLRRSPPPRELVKSQIAGLHPQSFRFRRWGPERVFLPAPGDPDVAGLGPHFQNHSVEDGKRRIRTRVLFLVHPENLWALKWGWGGAHASMPVQEQ